MSVRASTRLAARLLGRHVGHACPSVVPVASCARASVEQLGEAEVEDLHVPSSRDHQVRRLDVAMDDAVRRAPWRGPRAICIAQSQRLSSGSGPRARAAASASRPRSTP